MGIGPVYAVPRLLDRAGLKVDDIDLWELNEAFASQCLYCRDTLGIDPEKYNVNGGSISVGHPFGMTGARCVGHILLEGKRRKITGGHGFRTDLRPIHILLAELGGQGDHRRTLLDPHELPLVEIVADSQDGAPVFQRFEGPLLQSLPQLVVM